MKAMIVPVNKLVSLTWLFWALRSFLRFTLHYFRRSPTERLGGSARSLVLPLSSSTLLVRVAALLLLTYPRDQCSTFYLLLILFLCLHPALWRVIPMPMMSKPTSTAWHIKLILQFESFRMPQTPLMNGCRLIACF